jgi:type II restriction/modification system DNA methylase subunit YeeA
VSLQLLLGLEKEVITFATQLGFSFKPQVSVQQLKAIEINPYAYELAQVSVQIGYLQWRRDNGFDNDRTPVLQNLDGFENKDALLHETFRKKPRNLKEARRQEHHHSQDEMFKVYVERAWPECDVIVGNPPFLGGKLLRRDLGSEYVEALFENFGTRVRPEADLCCYWFEKAREQVEERKCKRAGLLATQGIRGGANRDTLRRIKETGDIFFAESDRDWVLAGANVHVSMVGFDGGGETNRILDGRRVEEISPQLAATAQVHNAVSLRANVGVSFMGITPAGPFDVPFEVASEWLIAPNPPGKPNSDVLRPYFNGNDLTKRPRDAWTVDFGVDMVLEDAAGYAGPFGRIETAVRAIREKNRREAYVRNWWIYAESRPAMREALAPQTRFLATCMVAKHRMFTWLDAVSLPANVVIVFGRSDDYFFGVLQSRFHQCWSLHQGTRLETRPRYTPSTCFETFPFPFPDDLLPPAPKPPAKAPRRPIPDLTDSELLAAKYYFVGKETAPPYRTTPGGPEERRDAIAAAAKELNELRERWLNPPEWTVERVLEFPGSVTGPWARYVVAPNADGIGTVRYPRLEPRDAECAAKLKQRTLTNLYNERPAWLDLAHKKLDAAVAAAYGWPADLSDEQILERLLALNLERAKQEETASLAKPKRVNREKVADEMI